MQVGSPVDSLAIINVRDGDDSNGIRAVAVEEMKRVLILHAFCG